MHMNPGTRQIRVVAALGVIVIGALALGAGPANAGPETVKLRVSKHKDGPFQSTVHYNLDSGEKRTMYLRVKSKDEGPLPIPVTMSQNVQANLQSNWFKGRGPGGQDITSQVVAGTYMFDIDSGAKRFFRWKIEQLDSAASCGLTAINYPDFGLSYANVDARGNCG